MSLLLKKQCQKRLIIGFCDCHVTPSSPHYKAFSFGHTNSLREIIIYYLCNGHKNLFLNYPVILKIYQKQLFSVIWKNLFMNRVFCKKKNWKKIFLIQNSFEFFPCYLFRFFWASSMMPHTPSSRRHCNCRRVL